MNVADCASVGKPRRQRCATCGGGCRTRSEIPLCGACRSKRPDYIVCPETGCWLWQHHITDRGYGYKQENGKNQPAHRIYYLRAKGPIPTGLQIDHLCMNRLCVNPEHLEAVTPAENQRRRAVTKVTESQVRQIRADYAAGGVTLKELGLRYGLHGSHVCRIVSGRYWKPVTHAARAGRL